MKDELSGFMELSVPQVSSVPQIMESMEVYDVDKKLIFLDDRDKEELATLFLTKGGMSGVGKKVKEMDERAKEVGSPWMLARGVKTVKVPGVGTVSLTEGSNVSISGDTLRKVLINYVGAQQVVEILDKVTKKTEYITLQFKGEKGK